MIMTATLPGNCSKDLHFISKMLADGNAKSPLLNQYDLTVMFPGGGDAVTPADALLIHAWHPGMCVTVQISLQRAHLDVMALMINGLVSVMAIASVIWRTLSFLK